MAEASLPFRVASFRRHRHNVADLCRACFDQRCRRADLHPLLTTNRPDGHHDASTSCVRRSARMDFTGGRGDFFRLVGRGALLELITAGLYRFWLATDMRRALWSGTSVDGDAPEYTGTAKELLIGFLFALAILVPIYVVYFLIGIEAERAQGLRERSARFVLLCLSGSSRSIARAAIARRARCGAACASGCRARAEPMPGAPACGACSRLLTLGLRCRGARRAERYKMRHTALRRSAGRFEGDRLGAVQARLVALAAVLADASPLRSSMPAYQSVRWRWWASASASARCASNQICAPAAMIDLYWKVIGWIVLVC